MYRTSDGDKFWGKIKQGKGDQECEAEGVFLLGAWLEKALLPW